MARRTRRVSRQHQFGARERPSIRKTRPRWRTARANSGFATTVGIIHDGTASCSPLGRSRAAGVSRDHAHRQASRSRRSHYNQFQKNLIEGKPNDWSCRAGSRYLYICEDGLVHYCSQQRGAWNSAGEISSEDLAREYQSVKRCAPIAQFLASTKFDDRPVSRATERVAGQVFPGEIWRRSGLRSAGHHSRAHLDVLATGKKHDPQENYARLHACSAVVSESSLARGPAVAGRN